MNLREEILRQTKGGLTIFQELYPGAYENAMGSKKPFRQGNSDKNPSCHMVKDNDEWKLINYGEDAKPISAFDCYMEENGITNIKECFYTLAERFHIDITLRSDINHPSRKTYTAVEDNEKEGDFTYKEKEFTANDVEIWGQKVSANILQKYNYKSLEWYSKVFREKDKTTGLPTSILKKVTVYSSPDYPIYLRECGSFRKIYIPCEPDKSKRFFYNGIRPENYVNGLEEALQAAKGEPLPEILICSGERDSMNAAAYGYYPIWFNSETSNTINSDLIKKLHENCERIINIPDIDDTGLKVAYELARRFPNIYTLILPDKLRAIKDNRGNPRKDLRDYLEIWSSEYEFKQMLNNTVKTEFWSFNDKGKVELSTTNLLWFLKIHGFYKYKDAISQQTKYVRIHDYMVTEYEGKEIRDFIRSELKNLNAGCNVLECYLNSKKCTAALFDDMDIINLDFNKATFNSRTFFFTNTAIKVTKDEVKLIRKKDIENYAWDKSIIQHEFTRLNPTFQYKDGNIVFNHIHSNLLKVIINTSRIYWREEYEQRTTGNAEEDNEYRKLNHFCPRGTRLTDDEINEQMEHLYSKLYALGYIIHTYKLPSRARALWLMENKISDEEISSGGSGKSFVMTALELLGILNVVTLEGRDKKLTDNNHFMDRVSAKTDLLLVDDANDELDFDRFYTMITNSITINPKGKASYQISFKDAPNVAFTSNFAPPRLDASTQRRLLPMVFSDYYHVKTPDNDYLETYTIRDDFNNRDLMDHDYTEKEFNEDINFLIDCEQYYLTLAELGIIKYPPMESVYKRATKRAMGDIFKDWADTYFQTSENRLERFILKTEIYQNYCNFVGNKTKAKTITYFMKALRRYASYYNYEINMPYLKGYSKGRILQTYDGKTAEFVYLHDPATNIHTEDLNKNALKETSENEIIF